MRAFQSGTDIKHKASGTFSVGASMIAVLLVAVVTLVGWVRLSDRPMVAVPDETRVLTERTLYLDVTREGAVQVKGVDESLIVAWDAKDAGFVSTIARVIKRERIKRNADVAAPVILRERAGNRLTIFDPEIDRETELKSFGKDNVAVFRALASAE